ncbi:MAG: MSCRAMM family adhesin SdrC, partial [Gemmataceae bacterium]|nr:MSCRAMM family adhesin SdrC [Gemmataceae bacterium]
DVYKRQSLGHLITDEDLRVDGAFTWVSGTLRGVNDAGSLTVLGNMTLNGVNDVRDFHLINAGVANWTAGDVNFYGKSKFTNLAGASLTNTFDGIFGGADGTCPVFYNDGTFIKSDGTGTTTLRMQLYNSGVVQIDSGNLFIHCGLVQVTTINEGGGSSTGTISGEFTGSVSSEILNPGDYTVEPAPSPPPPVTNYTQTASGTLITVIGGYVPGIQYGQIVVNDGVSLDGWLQVQLINGFVPTVGDQFTIILNNGSREVEGHFIGLADPNAIIWAGDYAFTISYTGGDGNDVVLTMVKTAEVSLSGRIFDDRNNDGIFNGLDVGIAGVAVSLINSANVAVASTETDALGYYLFRGFFGGDTYRIVAAQPNGYLDGRETAGNLGGSVDNSQDSDTIAGIVLNKADVGTGYDFAELRPSRIQGLVWEDANDNGEVDFGERAIPGVEITLMGIDDRGQSLYLQLLTDQNGIYEFTGLRPGNYSILESQPAEFPDGRDSLGTVNGTAVGTKLNDRFDNVVLTPGSDAVNYNFGELVPPGGTVHAGQTASIAFWKNKKGQALIKSLNGGPNATDLGNWLATNFPNMYGANAGPNNLTGKTNAEVAAFYVQLHKRNGQTSPGGPPKLDAQVLATALAVYVTNQNLAGTAGIAYGFEVTATGVGSSTFNIGTNGAAFGVADHTVMTVLDILRATDSRTRNGILYDLDGNGTISKSERKLRVQANDVYSAINEAGGI